MKATMNSIMLDMILRNRGYKIVERSDDPVWAKDGAMFKQSEVCKREGIEFWRGRMVILARKPTPVIMMSAPLPDDPWS